MKIFLNLFLSLHIFLYRISGGKLLGNMGGNAILLLNNVGRKSGKQHTIPLLYLKDGDDYVITASNGGAPNHPGWYYNLRSTPETTIEVMGDTIPVTATVADQDDRARLWAKLVQMSPQFEKYEAKTTRQIQMFILRPKS